eukprot:1390031-Amphidinium_carterae.1
MLEYLCTWWSTSLAQDAMNPLGLLDWYYKPFFLLYIFFMFFGVLNVVIGALLCCMSQSALVCLAHCCVGRCVCRHNRRHIFQGVLQWGKG